jgi:adenosylmethionine-8-amino-7-oxononanoate aminotransferase
LAALGALPLVGDVRGMGLLAGVEFVADRHTRTLLPGSLTAGKRVAAECRRRGLIVRPLGDVVGISPPLVITEEQIDALVDILAAAILTVADGLVADGIRLD